MVNLKLDTDFFLTLLYSGVWSQSKTSILFPLLNGQNRPQIPSV